MTDEEILKKAIKSYNKDFEKRDFDIKIVNMLEKAITLTREAERKEIKEKIKKEWDSLLIKEFSILYSYDGVICEKCGKIQGEPNKKLGIKKYYCDWIRKKINKKIKKEKDQLIKKLFENLDKIFSEDDEK